jgi:hypothetical protein
MLEMAHVQRPLFPTPVAIVIVRGGSVATTKAPAVTRSVSIMATEKRG